jgi:pyruvate,water dikinase
MFSRLSSKGIPVPDGFATTARAFERFLSYNNLHAPIPEQLQHLDKKPFRIFHLLHQNQRAFV